MRVPLNGWVFIYEIGGCGFKSCCSHLIHLISKLDYNYAKFDRKCTNILSRNLQSGNFNGKRLYTINSVKYLSIKIDENLTGKNGFLK